jgi:hypothetical protein
MITLREGNIEPPTDPPLNYPETITCYVCDDEVPADEYEPGVWNYWKDAHIMCEREEIAREDIGG